MAFHFRAKSEYVAQAEGSAYKDETYLAGQSSQLA